MDRYRDWPRISHMTLDERLTAAAVIMRDAIEKSFYEKELSRVSRLVESTQATTSDSR